MDTMCTQLLEGCEAHYSTPVCGVQREGGQWVLTGKVPPALLVASLPHHRQ